MSIHDELTKKNVACQRSNRNLDRHAKKQDLPLILHPCPSRFQCELRVGKYTTAGEKLNWPTQWVNQDSYLVVPLPPNQLLVAVCDGHGEHGHHVAKQVKQIFEQQAIHISQDIAGPIAAFRRTFALCQASLSQQEELCHLSGTTATVALIDMGRQHVTVAHVGDSTLVIVRDGKPVFTTKDHKVDFEAEQRIRACGGVVQAPPVCPGGPDGARRVFMKDKRYPGLAMSRALGDLVANKLGVLAEPEVITGLTFAPQDSVLLATDGLWDVLPKERVVTDIRSPGVPDTNAAARSLVLQARERWPAGMDIDDITAVLVQAVPVSETVGYAGVAGSHSRSSSSHSSSSSGRTRTPDANAIPPWHLGAVTEMT
jgi:serine/threonine protein phosphatase PrpC